jgi:hypothetical protein
MRRSIVVAVLAAAALTVAPPLAAKEFAGLVIVGADGSSLERRPGATVIDDLFRANARARPRGGYLRLYPLGPTGHVGVPGRFYPRTGAVCLAWNQAVPPRNCYRAGPRLTRVLARGLPTRRFFGRGPTLARLTSPGVTAPVVSQLRVAVELAFDRHRLARRGPSPVDCVHFTASWRDETAVPRPRRFCLALDGVHTGGRVYPLGPAPYRLAAWNRG